MPQRLPSRVLVKHKTSGATKYVLRTQLEQLGPNWQRVEDRSRPPTPGANEEKKE